MCLPSATKLYWSIVTKTNKRSGQDILFLLSSMAVDIMRKKIFPFVEYVLRKLKKCPLLYFKLDNFDKYVIHEVHTSIYCTFKLIFVVIRAMFKSSCRLLYSIHFKQSFITLFSLINSLPYSFLWEYPGYKPITYVHPRLTFYWLHIIWALVMLLVEYYIKLPLANPICSFFSLLQ